MKTERRQHVRVPGPFSASLRLQGRNVPVRILNLSEGGCYVEGGAPPPGGKSVVFEISFPTAGSLVVSGEALLTRSDGYAVLFGGMTDANYSKLERIINNLRSMVP